MKKVSIVKGFTCLVIFLSLLSCQRPGQQEEAVEESFGAAPVKVYQVKKQKISEKLYYTGLIEAWKEINITPDVGGKIAKIYVEEGDTVKKGQLLAELDTRAIRLQREQAEAAVAVAEANFNDAKRNMARMERLKNEDAVSDQQYEKIKLAHDAAEAQLQQARAALNLAIYNLDVSIMKAPFAGVVASKNAEVGDVINPLMGPGGIVTLMDFSRIKIGIDISHQDIIHIKKGQTAFLNVSAIPNRVFEGRVALVNLTADPMTKKFGIEVRADNTDFMLRPNTYGEVVLEVKSSENALAVPQKAVLENIFVFVVRGNTVEKREVVLGLQNTDLVEILSGIEEGEQVVVEGNFGLEDGAEIEIKEVIQ
jgi:RND family efflux transporter MFP subunit